MLWHDGEQYESAGAEPSAGSPGQEQRVGVDTGWTKNRSPVSYHGIVRGSPKCGRALVAAKRVMCEMRSPSSVSTSSESARPTSVCGSLAYWPNAGWELARVGMRRRGFSRVANAWAMNS